MNRRETTILGVTYEGRPIFGSFALRLWLTERKDGAAEAQALLDAHNKIREVFGHPPVDLTDDFTPLPMEGLTITPAGRGPRDFERESAFDRVVKASARAA